MPVTGQTFEGPTTGGPVGIHWGGQFGPLLAVAPGPDFRVRITVPADAVPGYYYVVAYQYSNKDGSVTGKSSFVYEVTGTPLVDFPPPVLGSSNADGPPPSPDGLSGPLSPPVLGSSGTDNPSSSPGGPSLPQSPPPGPGTSGSTAGPTFAPALPGTIAADPARSDLPDGSTVSGPPRTAAAPPVRSGGATASPSLAAPSAHSAPSGPVGAERPPAHAGSPRGPGTDPSAVGETSPAMPIPDQAYLWGGLAGPAASLLTPTTTSTGSQPGVPVGAVLVIGGLLSMVGTAAVTGKRQLVLAHQARSR